MLEFEKLGLPGVYLIKPPLHHDSRGLFREWFNSDSYAKILAKDLRIAQSNTSYSSSGTVRGIHFSLDNGNQWKLISCPMGRITDFVVDTFPNSTTFGKTLKVNLDSRENHVLFIPGGMGHGFYAHEDSIVTYSLGSNYAPNIEKEINVFDPALNLIEASEQIIISEKDKKAPMLHESLAMGILPFWDH